MKQIPFAVITLLAFSLHAQKTFIAQSFTQQSIPVPAVAWWDKDSAILIAGTMTSTGETRTWSFSFQKGINDSLGTLPFSASAIHQAKLYGGNRYVIGGSGQEITSQIFYMSRLNPQPHYYWGKIEGALGGVGTVGMFRPLNPLDKIVVGGMFYGKDTSMLTYGLAAMVGNTLEIDTDFKHFVTKIYPAKDRRLYIADDQAQIWKMETSDSIRLCSIGSGLPGTVSYLLDGDTVEIVKSRSIRRHGKVTSSNYIYRGSDIESMNLQYVDSFLGFVSASHSMGGTTWYIGTKLKYLTASGDSVMDIFGFDASGKLATLSGFTLVSGQLKGLLAVSPDTMLAYGDFVALSGTDTVRYVAYITAKSDVSTSISNGETPSIKVFPNPASNHISVVGCEDGVVNMLSLTGQVLLSRTINNTTTQLDLFSIPNGVYHLVVARNSNLHSQRIVVIRE